MVGVLTSWEAWKVDPFRAWYSCTILSRIISTNEAKEKLLAVNLGDTEQGLSCHCNYSAGEEPVPLMHSIMHSLGVAHRESLDVRVEIGVLCLMSLWLYESSEGVSQFLGEGVNLQNVQF